MASDPEKEWRKGNSHAWSSYQSLWPSNPYDSPVRWGIINIFNFHGRSEKLRLIPGHRAGERGSLGLIPLPKPELSVFFQLWEEGQGSRRLAKGLCSPHWKGSRQPAPNLAESGAMVHIETHIMCN